MNKEHNFVSAVVLASEQNIDFLRQLYTVLDTHFIHFEIIIINPHAVKDGMLREREWARSVEAPVTIVNMSLKQPQEQCMNAGLDIAIGDYVYEFDSTYMPYDAEMIWEAYLLTQKGNDIVSVCPSKVSIWSKLFYKLFNAHSNAEYKLRTDAFRIISRRAINRVHAMNENLPYRKAAYAVSGLKMAEIIFPGKITNQENRERASLALDSIILYTNYGFKISIGITSFMMLLTLAELAYAIFVYMTGKPVSGWSSTAVIITVGFTGMFGIFTIMLKYLSIILRLIFKKQSYLIESIEKL